MIKNRSLQSVGLKDLKFCDALRWHDNQLWFSDLLGRRIYCYDYSRDEQKEVAYVGGQPSGLGHLSDGSLIVASMIDRLVLRYVDGKLSIYQDLASVCSSPLNDLVVDAHDRIYIGSFGFQAAYEEPTNARPSNLYLIDRNQAVSIVAEELLFPNGMAITPEGTRLIVAETFANRLTSFDIDAHGNLSNRALLCDLKNHAPDGLCIDQENNVWVGCPFSEEFLRVSPQGDILEVLKTEDRWAVSPVVGGPDKDLLFLATAETTLHQYHNGVSGADIAVTRLSPTDNKRVSHER